MGLERYQRMRDFSRTPEPSGEEAGAAPFAFVVHKHAASHLHYDFRLELEGVLLSWAVPKGPSLDPQVKRLAMRTEDHPVDYRDFEGIIPKGQYGGGTVMVWDRGRWAPEGDPQAMLRKGHLRFRLEGDKLRGEWHLVRTKGRGGGGDKESWLLFKARDEAAAPGSDVAAERPASVLTGRSMDAIAQAADRVWDSEDGERRMEPAARVEIPQVPGARRRRLPEAPTPQLATLVAQAPEGDRWLHEMKYDGYRLLARVEGGRVRLITRRGQDWTRKMPGLARALAALPVEAALLDGEVVVLQPDGTTDFQALQTAIHDRAQERLVYFAFDLLHLDEQDLTGAPLEARKEALRALLEGAAGGVGGFVRYGDHVVGQGGAFFRRACEHRLEGIVSKRRDARYQGKRTRDWLKVKCTNRQELVVVGWTDPKGGRTGFGALVVAVHQDGGDGGLRYAGRVGTGFDEATLRDLHGRLRRLERKTSPLAETPRELTRASSGVHWVTPKLVAEVEFTEWTSEGLLRHPSFKGLREDKAADEVTPERPAPLPSRGTEATPAVTRARKDGSVEVAGVRLTHPDRVLFDRQGVTKRELAEYYVAIADHVLPHMARRPLTLVRCPKGASGHCFYQRHARETLTDDVLRVQLSEDSGEEAPYIAIDSLAGLIALVQAGALEIHTWGATLADVERPDRVVFDLDPDADLPWARVVEGAFAVRDRLAELGLVSFLKTTGGKGLHVEVPIRRHFGWDEVKAFAHAVARDLVRTDPDRYTATLSKAKRRGKIFIDYLRNGRSATFVAAFSSRARPGATVAAPLAWDELDERTRPDAWNVRNLPDRLASLRQDPWADFYAVKQGLTKKVLEKLLKRTT